MHASLRRQTLWQVLLATAIASTVLPAQAGVSFAGPTVGRPAEVAVFTGRGFPPNIAVSVSITAPGDSAAVYGATVDARGVLRWQMTPTQPGLHKIQVLTTSGKLIREVALNVLQ